jgi:hypothetical protein
VSSAAVIDFLRGQRFGCLATIGQDRVPHVIAPFPGGMAGVTGHARSLEAFYPDPVLLAGVAFSTCPDGLGKVGLLGLVKYEAKFTPAKLWRAFKGDPPLVRAEEDSDLDPIADRSGPSE